MEKKYAAIDIGLKRIGCALSLSSHIVNPQAAILRKNRNQAAREVSEFLKEWDVDVLVVGYPESSEDMKPRVEHFVKLLEYNKQIVFQNENMSSLEAKELTRGEIKHKRDGRIDSIAAKIILERYLDSLK
jgi:putative holliday junction resolvase